MKKRILIIDDDPDILEAIGIVLDSAGYDFLGTTKGEETFQQIAKYKPDLIILDILLSGNDGRSICKRLKADATTQGIPIIMISAHPSARKSVAECGADSFVAKPFSISQLLVETQKYTSLN